jgi:hypothetical protein
VFTLDRPQTSDSKSNDLNLRTAGLSRSSLAIQQQPTQVNTWIKSSSHNFVRPELNWVATNQWSHGLCECSKDCNMCCYACACWCCFRHELSTMMGEHWCLWFITPLPLMDLRTKFRQQYAIEVKSNEKKNSLIFYFHILGFDCWRFLCGNILSLMCCLTNSE